MYGSPCSHTWTSLLREFAAVSILVQSTSYPTDSTYLTASLCSSAAISAPIASTLLPDGERTRWEFVNDLKTLLVR